MHMCMCMHMYRLCHQCYRLKVSNSKLSLSSARGTLIPLCALTMLTPSHRRGGARRSCTYGDRCAGCEVRCYKRSRHKPSLQGCNSIKKLKQCAVAGGSCISSRCLTQGGPFRGDGYGKQLGVCSPPCVPAARARACSLQRCMALGVVHPWVGQIVTFFAYGPPTPLAAPWAP